VLANAKRESSLAAATLGAHCQFERPGTAGWYLQIAALARLRRPTNVIVETGVVLVIAVLLVPAAEAKQAA
jgi:hypothetical protein